MQILSNKKRGVAATTWPRFAGRASRTLLGCVSVAAMVAMAGTAAKADDQVSIKEIHDLKARLKMLEKRMDKQAKLQKKVLRREAAYAPPYAQPGAGPVGPYSPPMPWDKKFHMNGITITPGGFLAAEGVWRARDQGGDFNEPFGASPEYNSPLAHMNELRFTSRQSRVSALVQGFANPDTLVSAYGEFDFLGAANSANSNESNSYNPRVRALYGTIDWQQEGWHVLAGQNWSLATLQTQGITPRNEAVPLTIDAQYVAGFTWTRQAQLRVTKNFGQDLWFAVSAEMPQTTGCPGLPIGVGAYPPSGSPPTPVSGVGITCNQESAGGGLLNQYTTYSINHIPDVIAKTAWEPTVAGRRVHLEAMGMYTDLYDQVGALPGVLSYTNTRYDTAGWGAGGGMIVPIMPKLLDFSGSTLIGRGIGRYGSGQLNDATFNPNGSLDALPEVMFLTNLTLHATPTLDIYTYAGEERILNANNTAFAGYSPLTVNNSGCYVIGGVCGGNTKDVWEITGGFWNKIYDGPLGSVRVGLQYEYIERSLFSGTGASGGLPAYAGTPRFNEQDAYASFRYYPFDVPAPAPALTAKY